MLLKLRLILLALLIFGIESSALNKSSQQIKPSDSVLIKKNLKSGIITIIDKRKSKYANQNHLTYSTALNLDMDSIWTIKAPLDNAIFKKLISFENGNFLNNIDFSHSVLYADADFRYVNFSKIADFSNTHFQTASFFYSNFGNGNFDSAVFSGAADFGRANFYGEGTFSNATFNAAAYFQAMENDGAMNFCGAVFRDTTDFTNSTFHKPVIFEDVTFSSQIDFENTAFEKKLYLNDLKLSNETQFNFDGAALPDSIDFSYNGKIANEVDFTMANLGNDNSLKNKPVFINLYRTDIAKLKLDYIHFKLYFSGKEVPISYYGVQSKSSISNDEKNMIYEALLNNFQVRGQIESYKLLDIEYQQFKLISNKRELSNWLFKYWWNYGYDKEYIFRWTLCFMMIFSLINIFLINKLNANVYLIESIPNTLPEFVNLTNVKVNFRIFFTRFWFSLVYTAAIFFKVTLKIENFKFTNVVASVYLFVIYITGLICLAYMANFIIQK